MKFQLWRSFLSTGLLALFFILCLTMMGCGSLRKATGMGSKKKSPEFQVAIQKVLDARNDIRLVISHVPRNQEEIDGPGRMDPSALIFSVQDYAVRLRTISLKDCPQDFKTAYVNYAEAWDLRAAASPGKMILLSGGKAPPDDVVPEDARGTEFAWRAVKQISVKYGAVAN